jgi:hypothetical protein
MHEPHETNLEADLGFDSLHAGNSHVLNIELRARNRARAACTWDVFRFCFSAIPNLDRIIVCLEREKQNISKLCQAVMSANGH